VSFGCDYCVPAVVYWQMYFVKLRKSMEQIAVLRKLWSAEYVSVIACFLLSIFTIIVIVFCYTMLSLSIRLFSLCYFVLCCC